MPVTPPRPGSRGAWGSVPVVFVPPGHSGIRLLVLLLAAAAGPATGTALAHSREKQRLDALELALASREAVAAQKIKDALEAVDRISEALKERVEHARHLEERIGLLRSELETGLTRHREGSDRAAEDFRSRVEKRLEALSASLEQDRTRHRQEAEALAVDLNQLRAYMTSLSTGFNESLVAIRTELGGLRQQQDKDRTAFEGRLQAMLEAVDAENRKLREAIARASGAPVPGRTHKVKQGESLYGLAKQYGVTVEALQKANPDLTKPGVGLRPGMDLAVPSP